MDLVKGNKLNRLEGIKSIHILEGEDLNLFQKVARIGSWKYDIENGKFYGSEEMLDIYDIAPEEFKKDIRNTLMRIHEEDQDKVLHWLEDLIEGKTYRMEFRIPNANGTIKYVLATGETIFNEDGRIVEIIGVIQNITEKKVLESAIEIKNQEMLKLQKRFEVLVRESNDIFEILDTKGKIKYISNSVEKVAGFKQEEIIGKNIFEIYKGTDLEKIEGLFKIALQHPNKIIYRDISSENKNGEKIYLTIHMQNLINEPSIEGIVINLRDITKRIQMKNRLEELSTHDELTGLPNRVLFKKQLIDIHSKAKKINTKFALMMLEIEGIKYVNYSFDYDMGYILIKKVVQRLKGFLGENNNLYRYSDDTFAIIIRDLESIEEYRRVAEKLIALFYNPFKVDKYEFDVFVHMGITIYPDSAKDMVNIENMDTLSKNAKHALLRAKGDGKNRYRFISNDIDIHNYKECVLRNDLHSAIEKQQLKVFYQPMVCLKNNQILAAEALIRWNHPDWGMISPDEFITIAEETGLILDIGKWVIRQVCKDYKKKISKMVPQIKIAINISGIQLLEKEFVNQIKSILDEYKLGTNFLILEITESILLRNTDKVISDIRKLQYLGIQVALDDFGTGFSSLSYLKMLNIDILKLDSSFVRNLPYNKINMTITKYVIFLARELNIETVAEGIETFEEYSYLKELDCYMGQGYIYSKPVPLEELIKRLRKKFCRPKIKSIPAQITTQNLRKYYRIKFYQLLETDMTILKINRRELNVGYTKSLIKDIGPGGLCFITNMKFPVNKEVILQFKIQLLDKKIPVYGCPVWTEQKGKNIYEYGVEFTITESERTELTNLLNQVQIMMKNNIMFSDGKFTNKSPDKYFEPK